MNTEQKAALRVHEILLCTNLSVYMVKTIVDLVTLLIVISTGLAEMR